ncbi:MAG: zinc ribbon domain-containing protein [Actinobacteria bacterium]|nr:zinc ribbon domain-containing protein [Actinomycetota bacterium]
MASYDLHCCLCGKDFDIFVQGFLKDEHKVCPECGGREVEQKFTAGFMTGAGAGASTGGVSSCSSHSFG